MSAAAVFAAVFAAAAIAIARRAAATPRRAGRPDPARGVGHAFRRRLGSERRLARAAAAMPGALEAMAQSLRSGCSVRDGLDAAAVSSPALVPDLDALRAALDAGVPAGAAFDQWAARSRLPGVDLVAAAIEVSSRGGGSTARAVDGVAATVRERQRLAGDVRSLATQARLSAAVLALAPPAFAVLLLGADASVAGFVVGTRAGRVTLVAGVGLDVAGWLWMRRICGAVR